MAESSTAGDALVLPPLPLATGRVVRVAGADRRVARVELVVSTEDGGELRIPLEHRHGAWWPPAADTYADRVPPVDHPPPEG
ncbi:hypothetical protein GCU56_08200 [Geodermatophilus sabuli]|uniref:Uncharacterized protein n=1 Tax=Geodermatophilus sabuli TaxID=1564158 RepID=A0A7K3VYY5_9ACTN|nr:hypothetical protein [Geodermatophilus sabuli]NEK57851.1 hypothetical protein [Geodermatophilus sabuli]